MDRPNLYDLSVEWESRGEGSEELLNAVPTDRVRAEETLYRQGDAAVEFSIIKLGTVEVARQSEDGSKSILKILGPGEPVGAMAVLNDFPYPANVKALDETVVYRFSADILPEIQNQCPRWFSDVLAGAAQRITDLADRLESLNTRNVAGRLARELLQLADKHGVEENGSLRIDTRVTRQMLADMVGCRVESAIRTMSKWEQKGHIQTDESVITIRNPDWLRSRAE